MTQFSETRLWKRRTAWR